LLDRGYVELTGKGVDKTLSVTKKGLDLLNIVPEEVKDPILTALWERDLDKISKGTLKHEDFSKSIAEDIAKWCEEGKKKIRVGAVWVSDKPDTGKTTSVKPKGSKVAGRKTTTKSPAKKSAQLK
jgi:Topoisomerase IA